MLTGCACRTCATALQVPLAVALQSRWRLRAAGAAQRLWRQAERANEGAAHPSRITEPGELGNPIERRGAAFRGGPRWLARRQTRDHTLVLRPRASSKQSDSCLRS